MIKFVTPTGSGEAINVDEAVNLCREQAGKVAENSVNRLFSMIESRDQIRIICNKQKWIIEKPEQV